MCFDQVGNCCWKNTCWAHDTLHIIYVQHATTRRIAGAVQLANYGWQQEGPPRARILLQGPSGSGKTLVTKVYIHKGVVDSAYVPDITQATKHMLLHTVCVSQKHTQALADAVFADPKALVVINCKELSERNSVARLVGAPAGWCAE